MITFSATLTCRFDAIFSPFAPHELEQGFAWLASSGFDAAELTINDYDGLDVRQLKQQLDQFGLGCTTIATGQARKRNGLSLLSSDPNVVHKTQQRLREHIEAAALLGSQVTLGSLRAPDRAMSKTEYIHSLAEAMRPCVDYARQCNVPLIVEALNRYEISHLHSATDMMEFMALSDAPGNVGILWDVFHANIEDPDFASAIAHMGSRLRHVHLADSNRHFPGYGHLPIESIYNMLQRAGYQGAISLECFCLPSKEAVIQGAGPLLKRLRAL